jgi:hypothetical protein
MIYLLYVDADVEQVVIPFGFMLAAPSAFLIELGDVVCNSVAVLAVFGGVAVNLGLGIVQTLVAVLGIIVIGSRRTTEWQGQSHSKCTHQDETNWFSHMCYLHG